MVNHKFKVKYGFGPTDFVAIEAGPELEKAIYAWIKKTPVALGDRMIAGSNIKSIEPDYHAYTGWYDHYEPKSGDDWKQIERDCPDYSGVFDAYAERVRELVATNQPQLIGKGEPIDTSKPELGSGSPFAKQLLAGKPKRA